MYSWVPGICSFVGPPISIFPGPRVWYTPSMPTYHYKNESDFQSKTLRRWAGQGAFCQVFKDEFAVGRADTFVGWPHSTVVPLPPEGVWIEFKWARSTGPRSKVKNIKLRTNQIVWAGRAHMRPHPAGVVVGCADGWFWVPAPDLVELLTLTWEQVRGILNPFPVDWTSLYGDSGAVSRVNELAGGP